jgi:hypothetical protein
VKFLNNYELLVAFYKRANEKIPSMNEEYRRIFGHEHPVVYPFQSYITDRRGIPNKKDKGTGKPSSLDASVVKPSAAESADKHKFPARSSSSTMDGEGVPDISLKKVVLCFFLHLSNSHMTFELGRLI